VSLRFEAGKAYAIVGKSGAGKSTLLSLLAGLDTPTSGRVEYDGEDLAKADRDRYRARKAGVIFQGFNLLTNATALDNIVLSMNIGGARGAGKKAKALALLQSVGIGKEKARRKVLKLSGGEQQRVGIARALANSPEVVVADEPTGNLDKDTEGGILEIFARLAREEGRCVVVVTHSKRVAAIADEVWGLDKGSLRRLPAQSHRREERSVSL
jgi:putative ABC transport system ATP-binding protein